QDRLSQYMDENASLQAENVKLLQEAALQGASLEEKQNLLDEAHQHLGKKVREAAILQDRVEELSLQITEFDRVHGALQEAASQLESEFKKVETEKTEAFEKIQRVESEIKQWEEKWVLAEKRAQHSAEKIIELEKIEQCYAKLQS